MRKVALITAIVASAALGCDRSPSRSDPSDRPPAQGPTEAAKIETPGLHNVYRLTDSLYSGSSPEGDDGFRSLQELGVKTIISVDGARPDVERARQHGLRYVHLPIGYGGVPEPQALRLARAVRDLPGPVYLHCHYGKHRGPAAAAVVQRCLDAKCSADHALAWLRQAGTDPQYTGLYAAPLKFRTLTAEQLDRVPAEFPETAPVTALAELMVAIDARWDHLKQVRAAGWQAPPRHPDIDPAHEARQLAEGYRASGRSSEVQQRPDEFRRWLAESEAAATELEEVLRAGKRQGAMDGPAAEKAFRRSSAACTRCHAKYRDVPQTP